MAAPRAASPPLSNPLQNELCNTMNHTLMKLVRIGRQPGPQLRPGDPFWQRIGVGKREWARALRTAAEAIAAPEFT